MKIIEQVLNNDTYCRIFGEREAIVISVLEHSYCRDFLG